MIGEKMGETKGRRVVRRVLSVEPATAEVTFEDAGTMFGVTTTGMGTYTSHLPLETTTYCLGVNVGTLRI